MADSKQTKHDLPHEAMVRDYLSATLDAQSGRAEARFRQFVAEQNRPASAKRRILHLPDRFRGWTLGIAGAALAASLAALWAGPSLKPLTRQDSRSIAPVNATPVNDPVFVERDVRSQTFDDGTYLTEGDTPVRVLRRHDLERTRWFDQNENLQREQVVPQDHVVYVPMKTY